MLLSSSMLLVAVADNNRETAKESATKVIFEVKFLCQLIQKQLLWFSEEPMKVVKL